MAFYASVKDDVRQDGNSNAWSACGHNYRKAACESVSHSVQKNSAYDESNSITWSRNQALCEDTSLTEQKYDKHYEWNSRAGKNKEPILEGTSHSVQKDDIRQDGNSNAWSEAQYQTMQQFNTSLLDTSRPSSSTPALKDKQGTLVSAQGKRGWRSLRPILHLDIAIGLAIRARGPCYSHNLKRRGQRQKSSNEATK